MKRYNVDALALAESATGNVVLYTDHQAEVLRAINDVEVGRTYRVGKVNLRKGDKVVVKVDVYLQTQQREHLIAVMKRQFGEDRSVLILEGGMELSIIRDRHEEVPV